MHHVSLVVSLGRAYTAGLAKSVACGSSIACGCSLALMFNNAVLTVTHMSKGLGSGTSLCLTCGRVWDILALAWHIGMAHWHGSGILAWHIHWHGMAVAHWPGTYFGMAHTLAWHGVHIISDNIISYHHIISYHTHAYTHGITHSLTV